MDDLEKHKQAIQLTWKAVEDSLGVGATELFYKRLFQEYPEVVPMFPTGDFDMNEQAEKLFKTISIAVDYLNDVPALVPVLEDLGKKHASWEVQPAHYDAVGECLIWTLKTGLKDAWTEDVADAWVWVYQLLAKIMNEAGEKAKTTSAARKEAKEIQATKKTASSAEQVAAQHQPPIRSLIRPGFTDRNAIQLRPVSTALLIIDIQKELATIDENSPNIEYAKIFFPRMIENTARLIKAMRANRAEMEPQQTGSECIFTYCEALTDDSRDVSLDYKLSGAFLANLPCPSRPAQFIDGVRPVRGQDITLPKTSCSVFQSTNIDYVLRNLNVEQLVVCGQLTDQCVESAVRDAADRGYLVTVAEDACAAQSEGDHAKGLHGIRGFSRQLSTDQVLKELGQS
mmetsp:Transcript_17466/g.37734  ORF Transcript_17466/g.37734 Transcript_17466/m.37734 type:complete len:399 (-) Transcript_17466:311-1507(-)|eukprot:CAMPEP_0172532736 /NCGR_PEP_ID=MMETSP1067-20121228/5677_1 /TAXON_ID=265564 ORGANISM="Thalassiosira punctigera, Strain Tpunct2005C2" /NCGR_SAMPLE_ID=MMETSP1067 /ASSEMBLY_ACC=CAM_ASM_000444 /LENGTH=398 /DNA_ID=CAMNT_0013317285 /DNA_START=129 /DNA_END=1325 /DNA_ORIENTATION=+